MKTEAKKEIVVVTFSLSNNGAERVFAELSNEWVNQGHRVTVIQFEKNAYGSDSYWLDPRVEQITLSRKSIKNKIKRYCTYALDIRKWLKKHKNAIVVSFSFTTQVILVLAAISLHNMIVFSERNDPNNCPYSSLNRFIRNMSFYRADKVVFQTMQAKQYFPKTIQKKGVVIVNPINPELPERCTGERRKTIITAARLRPQKNISLLLDAFALFHEDYPDYELEIYGIGEELSRLKENVSTYGLESIVHFMGFDTDVNKKMCDAAMYVCSSDYEGISNSMLEAICMGVPTISTDCPIGGARATIVDGKNGLLVPVGDRLAIANAMKRVAGDKDLALRLSINGENYRNRIHVSVIAKEWTNLF